MIIILIIKEPIIPVVLIKIYIQDIQARIIRDIVSTAIHLVYLFCRRTPRFCLE